MAGEPHPLLKGTDMLDLDTLPSYPHLPRLREIKTTSCLEPTTETTTVRELGDAGLDPAPKLRFVFAFTGTEPEPTPIEPHRTDVDPIISALMALEFDAAYDLWARALVSLADRQWYAFHEARQGAEAQFYELGASEHYQRDVFRLFRTHQAARERLDTWMATANRIAALERRQPDTSPWPTLAVLGRSVGVARWHKRPASHERHELTRLINEHRSFLLDVAAHSGSGPRWR